MVGGTIAIVVGVIMLIIGGAVINSIATGDGIGDCTNQDYNGDGTVNSTDQSTQAYKQCKSTVDNGYTVLSIMSIMMIIAGVILSVRGFAGGS